eukprot:1620406-Prymnesium_polylepis.1
MGSGGRRGGGTGGDGRDGGRAWRGASRCAAPTVGGLSPRRVRGAAWLAPRGRRVRRVCGRRLLRAAAGARAGCGRLRHAARHDGR